ncbi:MAG TPA: hypothetical protein VEV44_14250 [Pseudoneobacillus sp.]|nr:hypothetical protein [Pseudoneobacillus sp.]
MKKLALLSIISILFLTALAKQQEVVPFLRLIVNGLTEHTNVPVLLPTYWSKQQGKSKKYTSVKVKAYENGFIIYFLSTDKPYWENDDALFKRHESNHIGELAGFVGSVKRSERPNDYVFYKKKEGVKLWIQP